MQVTNLTIAKRKRTLYIQKAAHKYHARQLDHDCLFASAIFLGEPALERDVRIGEVARLIIFYTRISFAILLHSMNEFLLVVSFEHRSSMR